MFLENLNFQTLPEKAFLYHQIMHMIFAAHTCVESMTHIKITMDWLRLEGTSGAHLVQTPAPGGHQQVPLGFLTGFAADEIK